MLDGNNPFNDQTKTEDISIEDNLFDDTDSKVIKKVSEHVMENIILVTILKFHLVMKSP